MRPPLFAAVLCLLIGCGDSLPQPPPAADPAPDGPSVDPGPTLTRVEAPGPGAVCALWVAPDGALWAASEGAPAVHERTADGWRDRSAGLPAGAQVLCLAGAERPLAGGIGAAWAHGEGGWEELLETGDVQPLMLATGGGLTVASCTYYPRLLRLDATPVDGPPSLGLALAWVFAPDDVVALGFQSPARRFSGGDWGDLEAWRALPGLDGDEGLADAWSPDGRTLLVAGAPGLLARLDGDAWELVPVAGAAALRGVYGEAPERCVAVGDGGLVLVTEDGAWRELAGATENLRCVRGDGRGRAWLGGEDGALYELRW